MQYPGGVAAPRRERPPPERSITVREALLRHLREGPRTAHELSGLVGIPEKQVADHLAHVARSLRPTAERLHVEPARCLGCGFVFRKRDRLDRPRPAPSAGVSASGRPASPSSRPEPDLRNSVWCPGAACSGAPRYLTASDSVFD
jgi:predicted Zn-ribbon and HTH transcriptional regulator